MLLATIQQQMMEAMKAKDSIRVGTMRMLIAAVKTAAINKYGAEADTKTTDADVMDVVKKQVKTHKESVEAFTKANRPELAQKEQTELVILEAYMPKELSDDELKALLAPVAATGDVANFGPLMGKAMGVVKGQASGDRVSAMLRTLLAK